ncbi:CD1375 family protein [Paenibacillus massiliensis]|nr:CD1375 family protein [Paenibacillus massiliensis]
MAKIYYDLITVKLKAIEDVPLKWRDQVQELLSANAE